MDNLLIASSFKFTGHDFGIESIASIKVNIIHQGIHSEECSFFIRISGRYYKPKFFIETGYSTGFAFFINLTNFYFSTYLPKNVFLDIFFKETNHSMDSDARLLLENCEFINFLYREINETIKELAPKIVYNFGI